MQPGTPTGKALRLAQAIAPRLPPTVVKAHRHLAMAGREGGPADGRAAASVAPPVLGASSSAGAGAGPQVLPQAPGTYVTCFVDYTTKYGLGFQLSSGTVGVYFNDASKIVLEPAPTPEAKEAEAKAVDGQLDLPGDAGRRF